MSFIYIWILLAVVSWYIFSTNSGQYLLRRYSPWKEDLVRKAVWMIAILAFVIANPAAHAIIAAAGLVSYWTLSSGLLFSTKENSILSNQNASSKTFKCKIICKPVDENNEMLSSRENLQRCLYSSPYIDQSVEPNIFFNSSEYTVDLVLFSDRYISSLTQFLSHSGFKINLINK